MTEIQKTRQKAYPGGWQRWFGIIVSLVLMLSAIVQSTLPNHQLGATATVFLSLFVYMGVYNFHDRRLSMELVQEMDALRLELEELKKKGSNPSHLAP